MSSRGGGPRSAGTDGSDHAYRQTVDNKYVKAAAMRKRLLKLFGISGRGRGIIDYNDLYLVRWVVLSAQAGQCGTQPVDFIVGRHYDANRWIISRHQSLS